MWPRLTDNHAMGNLGQIAELESSSSAPAVSNGAHGKNRRGINASRETDLSDGWCRLPGLTSLQSFAGERRSGALRRQLFYWHTAQHRVPAQSPTFRGDP